MAGPSGAAVFRTAWPSSDSSDAVSFWYASEIAVKRAAPAAPTTSGCAVLTSSKYARLMADLSAEASNCSTFSQYAREMVFTFVERSWPALVLCLLGLLDVRTAADPRRRAISRRRAARCTPDASEKEAFVIPLRMQRAAFVLLLGSAAPRVAGLTSPYPQHRYDYKSAQDYFRTRPLEVAGRAVELASQSAGFGASLLGDFVSGNLESKADERALDLVDLLTKLGPTFIKAGQSASIRTDLLPPAYIKGLTALQDRVPPFSNEEARALIKEELGQDSSVVFASLSNEPVAAASLGQVYKGKLPDGTEVAVKCQRPGMEKQIALDMHLIRDYAAPLAKLFGVPGDLVGTADAWGKGFVDELNYLEEKENAERFNENVQQSNMAGRVFAPPVIAECSTRRVLTTEWIDGERLDRSSAPEDVPRLCSVAMNIYLEMMLAPPGVLHCDPHPGNAPSRTCFWSCCFIC